MTDRLLELFVEELNNEEYGLKPGAVKLARLVENWASRRYSGVQAYNAGELVIHGRVGLGARCAARDRRAVDHLSTGLMQVS